MSDYTLEVHGCHQYDATGAISEPIYLSATYRHPGYKQSTGLTMAALPIRHAQSWRQSSPALSRANAPGLSLPAWLPSTWSFTC